MDSYCKAKSIPIADIMKPEYMNPTLKRYGFPDWDSLMAAIGHGGLKEGQIVNRLVEEARREKEKHITDEEIVRDINAQGQSRNLKTPKGTVKVRGVDGMVIRFSKCCTPVPGDDIVGFVTRGRGVSVHRTDCENVLAMSEAERQRLIEVEWIDEADEKGAEFISEINVYAMDRVSLLHDISKVFMEAEVPITRIEGRVNKHGKSTVNVQFGVKSKQELGVLISKIRNIEGIIDIERTSG